jgi:hypothetical protein
MTRNKPLMYSVEDEPIVLSKQLIETLKNEKRFSDLLALYTFYYYTAKWQGTSQPHATAAFIAEGMGWGIDKVQVVKARLLELGMISNITRHGEDGKIVGHYTKINLFNSSTTPVVSPLVVKSPQKFLINSNNNKLLPVTGVPSDGITHGMFDQFWELYPKHPDKGKALSKWNALCRQDDRPTWKEIKVALLKQIKSERWQNPKYIPHPTTWLNQSRWLDDPEEMISYNREQDDKPKVITEAGERWTLDSDGHYYNKKGVRLL